MSKRKMGFHAMPGYYKSKAIQTTVLDIQINKYAKMFTESSTEAKKLFRYLRRTITELSASRIDNNVIDCCDVLVNYLRAGVRYEFFMELESKKLSIEETFEALNKQALYIRESRPKSMLFVCADERLRNKWMSERESS